MVKTWWWLKCGWKSESRLSKQLWNQAFSASRVLLMSVGVWVWGTASSLLQSRGRIPATRSRVSSQSSSLWRAQPTAGWQSQLHWGQAKCRDWNSRRTKPRLCDHCLPGPRRGKNPFHMMHSLFSAKHTHQGPHLKAWLLYKNSSLRKQLKTAAGANATMTWMQ